MQIQISAQRKSCLRIWPTICCYDMDREEWKRERERGGKLPEKPTIESTQSWKFALSSPCPSSTCSLFMRMSCCKFLVLFVWLANALYLFKWVAWAQEISIHECFYYRDEEIMLFHILVSKAKFIHEFTRIYSWVYSQKSVLLLPSVFKIT